MRDDLAVQGFIDSCDRPQQRCLAGAVRAYQSHPVAGPEREGYVPQRFDNHMFVGVARDFPGRAAEQHAFLQRARSAMVDGKRNLHLLEADNRTAV